MQFNSDHWNLNTIEIRWRKFKIIYVFPFNINVSQHIFVTFFLILRDSLQKKMCVIIVSTVNDTTNTLRMSKHQTTIVFDFTSWTLSRKFNCSGGYDALFLLKQVSQNKITSALKWLSLWFLKPEQNIASWSREIWNWFCIFLCHSHVKSFSSIPLFLFL